MSGAVEMIAGAVVKHVTGKLSQTAWERMGGMFWNFKDDVHDMEDKMVTLQVALSYADKRSQGRGTGDDTLVHHWLNKYKSAAYDIEDAMDELEANATIWNRSPNKVKVKLCFSSINPLIVRITMSNKMRSIRLQLDRIAEDANEFKFLPSSASSTEQNNNERERETYIGARDDIQILGREREKKHILKLLQNYRYQESSIIPIVGLGGMGKTTIAQFVYTLKETDEFHFDLKAWVYVSIDFKLEKIIGDIISQLDGRIIPAKDATRHHLKSQLDHILDNKVYLIVLDDLWEESVHTLEKLVTMLQSGKKGSKIVVTTRSEKVASTLSVVVESSHFHMVEPIKLEGLSDDECWSIMKPQNLGDDQIIDFVHIGKEIAKQCNGVPLVAKALGYVMRKNCTVEGWLEIKNTNIMDIKDDDKGILKGLLLSYHHMPQQLKLCFMYCSIFPKGHDLDHDSLIQQCISLGFIQGSDGQLLQQTGIKYVNEFLEMSLLNILTHPTVLSTGIFKSTQRLRMHDMVHDLARHVAGDELSYTNGEENINTSRGKLNCNYHLLINHNKTSTTYKALSTKVRAMHFRECHKLQLPEQAFSHTLYLRVLDLSGCHVTKLPVSIYRLKLLRYLDASTLPILSLSKSLNRLLNLQTLILSNTSLNTLPTNIGCLQKLEYFDLSGCVSLCELPISFGNLSALLFLNLASCHELHTLPESFGRLPKLQFLNLSDCYKLHSLPESCSQLHDLTHLDLSDCHNLKELPDWIDKLSKLEYLNMTSCSKVQILPDSLCKLMMLKHLNLSFCIKIEHLPSSIGHLRLQSLDIDGCFLLGSLPDSIFNMSTLKTVEAVLAIQVEDEVQKLRESLNLQGSSNLDGGSSDIWSQIAQQLLERTLCHALRIKGLENVEHLEGAEHSKLSSNSKLKKMFLQWERDEGSLVEHADSATAISVLAKLLPPRSLQHLDLRGYMGIDFPRWMLDISSYLPHLTTIYLFHIKECNCLPPLGRLPNLRALALDEMPNIKNVGREFYGGYGSCQKLRIIHLCSMENLEEWWTTRSCTEEGEFLIPNLHMLFACDCPKLKFLPYPPRSMSWMLGNSNHVLPEHGFGNLSSSTFPFFLVIGETSLSCEGWRRTQHLSSIEGLQLEAVAGLRNLPNEIRCFKSLRKLDIESCVDLETLPEWLGDLTSLREIRIEECPKLSSLPESIRGLTELKKLHIIDCPELLEKCLGEDKHKIAHIPEVITTD